MQDKLSTSYMVEKSKALILANLSEYDVNALRLLEVYLSRINARNPDSTRVSFTVADYNHILGTTSIEKKELDKSTDLIMNTIIKLETKRGLYKRVLFPTCDIEMDENEKCNIITMECHKDLKEVFFNLAGDGYTKYRLSAIIKLTSRYSLLLYGILRDSVYKDNGFVMTVDDLRNRLGVTKYPAFRDFNKWVIKKSVEEISEKTDIKVEYETISRGRKVVAIRFHTNIKPTKKQIAASSAVAHDGHWYAEATGYYLADSQAMDFAGLIMQKIDEYYPQIPKEKRDDAAKDTLKALYTDIVENAKKPEIKSGAVMWSVMANGKAIENYIPANYVYEGL